MTGSIARLTDPQGHVNFVPRVGGWANANAVGVVVEGVVVGMVPGRSPDYDADGHVALSDLALLGAPPVQATCP